ncbi:MAG: pentapeptide repeat-containing protein, partial [Actinomycetota bacterium]|nr:pentapeptide repeat-containing protein [Actinomycetota bacterium]
MTEPVGLARWVAPPFEVASQLEDSAEYSRSYPRAGSPVNFNHDVLQGLDLADAELGDGVLWEADLSGSRLDRAWFHDAYVAEANLSGARLVRCRLRKTQWSSLDLAEAVGDGAYFYKSDMSESRWDRGSFVGASFLDSTLTDSTLVGADLRRADFRGTSLRAVDLTGADVSGADFDGAFFYSSTRLPAGFLDMTRPGEAWVDGEKLSGAQLHARLGLLEQPRRTDIPEVEPNFTPPPAEVAAVLAAAERYSFAQGKDGAVAVLARAQLGGVDLHRAPLDSADLSGAELSWARLDYSRLDEANLIGADLTGARLVRIHAWDSRWGGSNLSEAVGDGADFSGADLSGAGLDRASFIGVGFAKSNLSGASLAGAA